MGCAPGTRWLRISSVRMEAGNGELRVEIADDGRGGADPRAGDGTGLRGLADRVEALGGRLTLASPSGQVTTVRARVPLAGAKAADSPA